MMRTLIVAAAIATSVASCSNTSGSQEPGPAQHDSSGGGSGYYQKGYQSGKSGLARSNYGVDKANLGDHPDELEHDTCSEAVNAEVTGADYLEPKNQDDFMRGCLQAFQETPPTGGPKPGPLNPYR
jgi:hypothetical protein